jgi:hypothetical protein
MWRNCAIYEDACQLDAVFGDDLVDAAINPPTDEQRAHEQNDGTKQSEPP